MTAWLDIFSLEDEADRTHWAEYPVSLDTFVTDRHFLANPPLSSIQYEAVRYAERVYYDNAYPMLAKEAPDQQTRGYWAEPLRMVNFITLEWGKGGGKDHICRIISLRVAYLLMCLESPHEYFGLPTQDTIHLLNVAASAPQANRAFFTPMRRAVMRKGCWFYDKSHPLKSEIEYTKNIEAISGHSDAETQEGLNLILGVADEIDAFKTLAELEKTMGAQARESARSAEGVLKMLRSSARTRFPQTFKNVRISWPRYMGSMIQQLIAQGEQAVADEPLTARHFVSGPKCTWEVNPRVKDKSEFADDYKEDAAGARARYECRPGRAINPYFSNVQAVEAAFEDTPCPPVRVSYSREQNTWRPDYQFSADLIPRRGAIYAMHADLAVKGDRAGVCMAHVEHWQDHEAIAQGPRGEDVPLLERRPAVKVDFVISYEADAGADPPREIQIRWARMLALELRKRHFNIRRFTFDGYQSTDSMQILLTHGIEAELLSTDRTEDPWRTLRDLFSEGRIRIPRRQPKPAEGQLDTEIVLTELLGLSRLPNGKIDHLGDGSKDEADALACAAMGAVILGGQEDPTGARAWLGQESFGLEAQLPDMPMGMPEMKHLRPDALLPEPDTGSEEDFFRWAGVDYLS